MNEGVGPSQPPMGQELSPELERSSAELIELGGNQNGGSLEVPLADIEPITTDLIVNGKKASVLTVMYAGHHKLGLVDTQPTEPKADLPFQNDRLLLVDLIGDPKDDPDHMTIQKGRDGKERIVRLNEPDTMVRIGSDDGFSSVHFNELLGLSDDPALSDKHLRFRVTEEGNIGVYDASSHNGTGVLLRRSAQAEEQDTSAPNELAKTSTEEVIEEERVLEVQEELGETAVEEVVEEPELDTSRDHIPRRSQAMKELHDYWGAPEEMRVDNAVSRLQTSLNQIDDIINTLMTFDRMYPDLRRGIAASIEDNANRLDPRLVEEMDTSVLQSTGFHRAKRETWGESQIFLPASLERTIRNMGQEFKQLELGYRDMFNTPGGPLNLDDADKVLALMDRMPHEFRTMLQIRLQVEDMKQRLSGFHDDSVERAEGVVHYRNEEVERWADRLKDKDLTEEELEEIRQEMEQAVRMEVGMRGDPNSPSQFFDLGIRENMGKSRHGEYASGRHGGTRSQKYISEVMLDMLRGKFDVAGADTIYLNSQVDSGVEAGQHRSAALAMIYGAKEWVQAAKRLGYKIETK